MSNILTIGARHLGLTCRLNKSTFFNSPFCKRIYTQQKLKVHNQSYEVDTNVTKDVILFKYEKPATFKTMNLFAICQLFLLSYVGIELYSSLKNVPIPNTNIENLPWWRKINFGSEKIRLLISSGCFICAYTFLASIWIYTIKSVRFLVLNKGGNKLSFVTYSPFGRNRIITVPLNKVSCNFSRDQAQSTLTLRVAGKHLNYVLDMRGTFTNPQLFDHTAGIKRKL